jgi:hypothetical protein
VRSNPLPSGPGVLRSYVGCPRALCSRAFGCERFKTSGADDFASGGGVERFEDFVVGHSLLAEEFPLLLHQTVRIEKHIEQCACTALALYPFLVTVSDMQGLSFYSDASIGRRLKIDPLQLSTARRQLEQSGLIAFRKPLYQVLSLEPADTTAVVPAPPGHRSGQAQSAGDILRRILQGGGQ